VTTLSKEKGIDQNEWLNFIASMNKLDTAISEQRQAVLHAQNKQVAESNEFLFHQRKLKSYDTLSQHQKTSKKSKTSKV
jgi:flagellar FliJ protein